MDETKKARQRATQYWFNDGINEIASGVFFGLIGLYFAALEWSAPEPLDSILESSLILVVLAAGYGINKVVPFLKERITYPRSGYVSFANRKRLPRWAVGLLGAAIGGAIGAVLANFSQLTHWLPAIMGIIISAVYLYMAVRTRLIRIYLEAALALGLGIILPVQNQGDVWGIGLFYILFGTAIILIGGLTLLIYLRSNPIRAEQEND
jgi:hypothetical protein